MPDRARYPFLRVTHMTRKNAVPAEANRILRAMEGMAEILILTLLYNIFRENGYARDTFPAVTGLGRYVPAGIYMLQLTALFFGYEGFRAALLTRRDVMLSQCLALGITNFLTYWQLCLVARRLLSPLPMVVLTAASVLAAALCCRLVNRLHRRLYPPQNALLVYGSADAVALKFKMESRADKFRVTCLISAEEGLEKIRSRLAAFDAVVLSDVPAPLRGDLLKHCFRSGIRVYITPNLTDILLRGGKQIHLFDTPLLRVEAGGLSAAQRFWKRAMDLAIGGGMLLLSLPVMLAVAVAIRLEDGGPVFYRQTRVSLDGRAFEILKFRSMIVNAEQAGQSVPACDRDPRITRVGRLIRATRVDELPQLWNILRGEMSVVGPRPERVEHMERYCRDLPEFDLRLKVKGGLTGYAQIYGKYNTTPCDKLRLDLQYIRNYSLLLDLKLILLTLRVMLKKESTEGFDRAEAMEKRIQEAIEQLHPAEMAGDTTAACP